MSELEDLVETGVGAVLLAFGAVAAATIYAGGPLGSIPGVLDRFATALAFAVVPPLSIAAWPNAAGVAAGTASAIKLDGPPSLRAGGYVAAYLFFTVVLHYAAGTA